MSWSASYWNCLGRPGQSFQSFPSSPSSRGASRSSRSSRKFKRWHRLRLVATDRPRCASINAGHRYYYHDPAADRSHDSPVCLQTRHENVRRAKSTVAASLVENILRWQYMCLPQNNASSLPIAPVTPLLHAQGVNHAIGITIKAFALPAFLAPFFSGPHPSSCGKSNYQRHPWTCSSMSRVVSPTPTTSMGKSDSRTCSSTLVAYGSPHHVPSNAPLDVLRLEEDVLKYSCFVWIALMPLSESALRCRRYGRYNNSRQFLDAPPRSRETHKVSTTQQWTIKLTTDILAFFHCCAFAIAQE